MAEQNDWRSDTGVTEQAVEEFRAALLGWFRLHRRDFPWRAENASLYLVVIAELMLQRTTAAAVANVLPRFIDRFPSWDSISSASTAELEEHLRPLGLWQRRVETLQRLAAKMVSRGGVLPRNREEIEELPGVGQYIANAILLFGHGEREPLLDVNMSRVLERYFGPRLRADIRYDPYLQSLSRAVVAADSPVDVNWAILDLGALVCRSRAPVCEACPLAERCRFQVQKSQ
ncbi:hypothetical protein [Longimicrobium sp.]|uniref:hypothetical protein n=1 Tax=Longimicrobium sp. TaxID=2029185 RepID=UPI002E3484CB|nr:hypothetical protein [Longimicrobium sp.]HEX6038282.1 hypothetical protein [Longimicrobium sp.]